MKKIVFIILLISTSLIFLTSSVPIHAATLEACGYHDLNLVMEQVPESWPEYNKHHSHMWLWNQYMDIYRYVEDDGSHGGNNGENEFAGYPSHASLFIEYGTMWNGAIAMAIGYSHCECCEMVEVDIAFNPAISWTMDRTYAEDHPESVVFYDSVLLHEMGHSWGMQTRNEDYLYSQPTVMHAYIAQSIQDSMQIHVPEAWFIRRNYDDQRAIPDLTNMGVTSKYADNSHLWWTNSTTNKAVYKAGESITVNNLTVENTGTVDLSNVHLRLYLSTDRTITTSDTKIGDFVWRSFTKEAYNINTVAAIIPSGLSSGTYYVGAIVTYNGYTEDALIWDNSTRLWDTITINSSDLIVQSIVTSPTSPYPQEEVNVTVTVKNQGTASVDNSFHIDFYKHRETAPPAGLHGDFRCNYGNLPAGVTTTCSRSVWYDSENTYKMWAQIDTDAQVGESNENNNVFGPQNIVVQKYSDLIVQSLTIMPINPSAGQNITVMTTVKNQGTESVGNFYVGIYKHLTSEPVPGQGGDTSCSIATGLAAGATTTCVRTVTYDEAGTYSMYAKADSLGYVAERYETNNVYGPKTIVVAPTAALSVMPGDGLTSSGNQGGAFSPSSKGYTLQNTGVSSMSWTASKVQSWVSLSLTSGTLPAGASTTVTVSINSNANSLTPGSYSDTVSFTNTTNSFGNTTRPVILTVKEPILTPTILYVSKDGNCDGNAPCYSTIQAAINAGGDESIVKVGQGEYLETPVKNNAGTVSITGGWNGAFTEQTGTTVMYAPRATEEGIVKVLPNSRVVAPQ
jgi:hypothetical protein